MVASGHSTITHLTRTVRLFETLGFQVVPRPRRVRFATGAAAFSAINLASLSFAAIFVTSPVSTLASGRSLVHALHGPTERCSVQRRFLHFFPNS